MTYQVSFHKVCIMDIIGFITLDRCWMYSIIMDLVRDIYSINNIVSKMHFISSTPAYVYLLQNHKNLVVDTLKNMSDLVLPLSSLGNINIISIEIDKDLL